MTLIDLIWLAVAVTALVFLGRIVIGVIVTVSVLIIVGIVAFLAITWEWISGNGKTDKEEH